MPDIEIIKLNESFVHVKTDGGIAAEISDYFKFRPPGYQFMPSFKAKMWDGYIRMFSVMDRKLQVGLLQRLMMFSQSSDYSVKLDEKFKVKNKKYSMEVVEEFTKSLKLQSKGKDIIPHDYQLTAIRNGINDKRGILLSPTASGKSLIQYCLIRWFLEQSEDKVLLIVPTISLVSQMYSDFEDYSSKNNWNVEDNCHMIIGGQDKNSDSRVYISTWQSIYKMGPKYFSQFGTVLGDECHLFKAQSLTSIMNKSENADVRIGLTGTVDSKTVHKLQLEGNFGRIKRVATTNELQKKGHLSEIKIKPIKLSYPDADRKLCKKLTYQEEIKWLEAHDGRNQLLTNLALSQSKRPNDQTNTLLLFNKIAHGEKLYDMISEQAKDGQKVFYVSGRVKATEREAIRAYMTNNINVIIVASFGVFSTGINIPNIHNIILASTSKSEIRVLQSIGRGLRKALGKTHMLLFDVFDDLRWKSRENYAYQHFIERLNIYVREKFEYIIHKVNM